MRIVVAMSGGVDSSVAAALLAEQGHDVIGLSMQLYDQTRRRSASFGSCCSLDDLHDARRVAAAIDIPHYILNFERQFDEQVVVELRQRVRRRPDAAALRALQQRPEVRDAASIARAASAPTPSPPATTRASSATRRRGRYLLKRGVDPAKDQSYFLFSLTQDQLARARVSRSAIGRRTRSASTRGGRQLPVADKPDSQEICFIPDDDYAAFVDAARARRRRATARSSTSRARRSAATTGIHRFTVGQRKGLGLSRVRRPARRCTCSRSSRPTQQVVVGPKASLERTTLTASGVNWIVERADRRRSRVTAQIRHRHQAAPATRRARSATARAEVVFDAPQIAITPGQAVVFYDGDVVVGGGWID